MANISGHRYPSILITFTFAFTSILYIRFSRQISVLDAELRPSFENVYENIKRFDSEEVLEKTWISDYAVLIQKRNRTKARKILLLELPATGYGDIFAGILTAYQMAVVTNREFYIRNSGRMVDIAKLFDDSVMQKFRINITEEYLRTRNVPLLRMEAKHRRLDSKGRQNEHNYRCLIEAMTEKYLIHIHGWAFLRTGVMNAMLRKRVKRKDRLFTHENSNLLVQKMLIRKVFKLNPEYIALYDNARTSLQLDRGNYISIQARIGAGVGEGHSSRFRYFAQNMDAVAKCLSYEAHNNGMKTGVNTYFLATDTPEFFPIFERYMNALGGFIRVVGPNWNHTGHARKRIRKERLSTDDLDRIQKNTFVELLVLGNGKRLVNLPSGFPDLAALIGSVDSQIVIQESDVRAFEGPEISENEN